MIKSASVVLGYLFLLASAYYLTYFGSMNIDVFQYLSVDDMIKGIAYPLRNAAGFMFYTLLIILPVLAFEMPNRRSYSQAPEERKRAMRFAMRSAFVICFASAVTCICLLAKNFEADMRLLAIVAAMGASMASVLAYWLVSHQLESAISYPNGGVPTAMPNGHNLGRGKDSIQVLLDYVVISTAAYLLVSAICFGLSDSNNLKNGYEYNYVVGLKGVDADSLGLNSCKLLYLGAVGDRYLFSDSTSIGRKSIVLDKEQLPVLSITHYAVAGQTDVIDDFSTIFCGMLLILAVLFISVIAYSGIKPRLSRFKIIICWPIHIEYSDQSSQDGK